MHDISGTLSEVLVLLAAAIVIVALFKRLQLSPVLGYIVAGGMIGPHGFSIISNIDNTTFLAEFGVVFLLFAIGLELSFGRLKAMRLHVFGYGTSQLISTATIIWGICQYGLKLSPQASIIIGGGLALSSTALVLQLLEERGEKKTQVGRLSIAILILQDLAVVPLLILVPLLASPEANIWHSVAMASGKAAGVLVVLFVVGRRLLRPVFRGIAALRSQELFIATILLVVLGAAFATQNNGLSLALGAFMAGLLIAETEYRAQVEADIKPFKGLLMGLFFMTVGMSIDFLLLQHKIIIIILATMGLMLIKGVVIMLLCLLFRFNRIGSIEAGLYLAQGGEFAFILFGLAIAMKVMPQETGQIALICVSLSMALTPLIVSGGKHLLRRFGVRNPVHMEPEQISIETTDMHDHIVIAGYGRIGKTVANLLEAENMHNYLFIDNDPKAVHEGRRTGYPVYYGDASRMDLLHAMGLGRARAIVVTVRDRRISKKTVEALHQHYAHVPIIARAWDRVHANELREAGAAFAIAEAFESSLMLGGCILQNLGIAPEEINRIMEQFRKEEYPVSIREQLFHTRMRADSKPTTP